jgi:hypothetical protein
MEQATMKRTASIITRTAMAFFVSIAGLSCTELQKRADSVFKAARFDGETHRMERVTAYHLNLRQEPSTKAAILAVLQKDDSLQIESERGAWLYVTTSEGKVGWVYNRYVTGYDTHPKGEKSEQQILRQNSVDSAGRQDQLIQPDSAEQTQENTEKRTVESGKTAVSDDRSSAMQPFPAATPAAAPQGNLDIEPLFEDEDVTGAGQPARPIPVSENSDSDPLFEDEDPQERIERLETGMVQLSSHPEPEPLDVWRKGPWGNAKLGTKIRYRIWRTVGSFEVKRIPVSVTEEVIAVEGKTVVLRGRREWRENGDLKSDETQFKHPKFVPAEQLKIWLLKHGEKTETEALQIGDQTLECEIYTLFEEKEIQTFSGDTMKVSGTKIFHLSKAVPGWRVRLRVKTEHSDEIAWQLLEFMP